MRWSVVGVCSLFLLAMPLHVVSASTGDNLTGLAVWMSLILAAAWSWGRRSVREWLAAKWNGWMDRVMARWS